MRFFLILLNGLFVCSLAFPTVANDKVIPPVGVSIRAVHDNEAQVSLVYQGIKDRDIIHGLGFKLYYSSTEVEIASIQEWNSKGYLGRSEPIKDEGDLDGYSNTDYYILISWLNVEEPLVFRADGEMAVFNLRLAQKDKRESPVVIIPITSPGIRLKKTELFLNSLSYKDNVFPVLSVPEKIIISAIDSSGSSLESNSIQNFLNSVTANDNEDGDLSISIINDSPSVFPIGDTVVTFSVTDASGNTTVLSTTVSVKDTAKPELILPGNIVVTLDSGNSTSVNHPAILGLLNDVAAKDNVDVNLVIKNNAPAIFGLGKTDIEFVTIDRSNNKKSANVSVFVTSLDNDSDGLPNSFEIPNGLNINDPADALTDLDGDGRSNLEEYRQGNNIALDDVLPPDYIFWNRQATT